MSGPAAVDLLTTTVRFARSLREAGVWGTPVAAIDAARALEVVDPGDREDVYLALRSTLVSRPEDFGTFDALFRSAWDRSALAHARKPDPPPDRRIPAPAVVPRQSVPSLQHWMRAGGEEAESLKVSRMGPGEALADKDFSTFGAAELDEVTRVAKRIARRLANRPSRRWEPARRGGRVHLRRTVRRSFRTGGEMVELAFARRKQRKAKLVVICDVSGSMDVYSRFLLQFLYALQNVFARVETFVFSTRIRRVTPELMGVPYAEVLGRLTGTVREWSGGTRIGESLADFNACWDHLVDGRTIVVILSDGWDTGEPEELGEAMRRLHRCAGKTIWLNPLAGSPGYQPFARGMQAALPHVDVFAPAHNLASLQALVPHLTV